MKNIVWTRIDDRLIHGQVMTQWIQYTEANEVLIIDDGVAKDSFLQMVMKSSVPGKISLKVLSVKDAIGYLNEDGTHEKIIILVKTPVVLDELSDAGVRLKSINVGGIGAKAGSCLLYTSHAAVSHTANFHFYKSVYSEESDTKDHKPASA